MNRSIPSFLSSCLPFCRNAARLSVTAALLAASLHAAPALTPAAAPAPDVLVLSDGDILHGKFVSEVDGKVTFHTDSLGDVILTWDKIKELHTTEKMAVFDNRVKPSTRHGRVQFASGVIDSNSEAVVVHSETGTALAPIPLKNAEFIMEQAVLDKQLNHEPSFFEGWNGSATVGATIVSATQNQYTVSGGVNLVRTVPTVTWLDTRNKTLFGFTESYGQITQPAYSYVPAPGTAPVLVPSVVTKSSITHFGGERDQYFSPRVYALGQVAFDHNFAQDLQLQQIYGGGIGWTAIKNSKQEFDLKGTAQYEEQQFISGTGNANQNLIGSTFAANYVLHLKLFTYTQALSFIPAYNDFKDYSASETDTFAFPAYKNLGFSVGTLDTYLNDAPFLSTATTPPTKPNSFQFTMGLTYAIKSKY
jgi:hypothetical protein